MASPLSIAGGIGSTSGAAAICAGASAGATAACATGFRAFHQIAKAHTDTPSKASAITDPTSPANGLAGRFNDSTVCTGAPIGP